MMMVAAQFTTTRSRGMQMELVKCGLRSIPLAATQETTPISQSSLAISFLVEYQSASPSFSELSDTTSKEK